MQARRVLNRVSIGASALCLALLSVGSGAASAASSVFQNPQLAPNPVNNIHNDAFLSDNYELLGPRATGAADVLQINQVEFVHPRTGAQHSTLLGECSAITFDRDGNVVSVCAGVPVPTPGGGFEFIRSIVTLDRNGSMLAYTTFTSTAPDLETALHDFGGAGYYYLDNQFRPVVALPDGRVAVYQRVDSPLSSVDHWEVVREVQVTGSGGAVPIPGVELYALVPAPDGTIWFSTGQGVVGTIAPDGSVSYLDLNDRDGDGVRTTGPDAEVIANSHGVGADGDAYLASSRRMYRLTHSGGEVRVVWQKAYKRGPKQKPGQVSYGTGTSPTLFRMDKQTYVTIADNAVRMNINVYRTATKLKKGQKRVFGTVKPFGKDEKVSDENSLIWNPGPKSHGASIYAENNWGNVDVNSTAGAATTLPGFARAKLSPDGDFEVAAVNEKVAVPSIVSKVSQASNLVYTYEKRRGGWFMTAMNARTLKKVFSVFVGDGHDRNNNYYSGLSLDPDGSTIWIGTTLGLTRVIP